MDIQTDQANTRAFLRGGGEMGHLIRAYDWSTSELSEPDHWPQSLKTTLGIILHSKFPMFLWWGPNMICFYNDAYRPSLGNKGKHPSILGMPAREAWSEIWEFISPLIEQIRAGSEAIFREDLYLPIYRNGKMEDVYWTFSYSPVSDETGAIGGVLVICTETTHKVQLIQHLQDSERRFQNLIQDAAVGIILLSGEEMKVEVVNNACCHLIDRKPSELLGRDLFEIIPETAAEFKPILLAVFSTGTPVQLNERPYRVYKDEKEIQGYLNLICQPYLELNGEIRGVIALCQDVTEQVLAQKNRETTLEQLRLSREAAQLGMFDMDLVKGTLEWDKRCRTLFGISHAEAVTYEHDFVKGLHPEDRERITSIIADLLNNPADGDYDVEYRTIGADDGRVRWVRAKGKVYFDANDRPLRFIGSVLDITHQKINEQRKNDFIAMVSHELKTPLTSLTGYMQLLLRQSQAEENALEYDILERAGMQAKKMTNLINGFLNLSRFESGKLELKLSDFGLDQLISEEIADLTAATTNIDIRFLQRTSVQVRADREKIGSVINNLLSNAIKYSSPETTISIRCEHLSNKAVISISDKGAGIKAEDLPHIFDRFYRVENDNTKDISGFGIGLYLSAEIIKFHKGRIWVESNYGSGSTFYFSLPDGENV